MLDKLSPRNSLFLASALLMVLAMVMGLAHAARLPLNSSPLDGFSYTHPCQTSAVLTPGGKGSTTVANLKLGTEACSGLNADVTLRDSTGRAVFTSGGQINGDSLVLNTALFEPKANYSAEVFVSGWHLPTVWDFFETPGGGGAVFEDSPGTIISEINWTLASNNPVQACFAAKVTTDSETPIPWKLTLDLSQPPFNGTTAKDFQFTGGEGWHYQQTSAGPGLLSVIGAPNGERATISRGQVYLVELCNYNLPPPAQAPGAYSVTNVPGEWTDTKACINTTVTGNGNLSFYFAWTAEVDMRPAIERIQSAGRKVDAYSYGGNEWMISRTPAEGNPTPSFTVTSNGPASISGTQSFTFVTCAMSW